MSLDLHLPRLFMKVKVTKSCLTLCDPMYCSLPDSSVHGILQARIREWVATPYSRGPSQFCDQSQVSHIAGGFFTIWATREAWEYWSGQPNPSSGDLPNPGIALGSPGLQVDSLPPGKTASFSVEPQFTVFCLLPPEPLHQNRFMLRKSVCFSVQHPSLHFL